jgi:redox-sensitive bicupin YhaK (pirin superfamily)
MVFTGKQTKEELVWQGPFVCESKASLMKCFQQYQSGRFPPGLRRPGDQGFFLNPL